MVRTVWRHQQHPGLRLRRLLGEVQEGRERRDTDFLLGYRHAAVTDRHAVDAERRPAVLQPAVGEHLACRRKAALKLRLRQAEPRPPINIAKRRRDALQRCETIGVTLVELVQHRALFRSEVLLPDERRGKPLSGPLNRTGKIVRVALRCEMIVPCNITFLCPGRTRARHGFASFRATAKAC
jgi:hypothetical protein